MWRRTPGAHGLLVAHHGMARLHVRQVLRAEIRHVKAGPPFVASRRIFPEVWHQIEISADEDNATHCILGCSG